MLTPLQSNCRDWYLDQLGITQYELRKPKALSGETTLALTAEIRLIIMADHIESDMPFFRDILSAIGLPQKALLLLKPEQATMLPQQLDCVIWSIDCDLSATMTGKTLTLIETKSLIDLMSSSKDKRQLWQQLCQYEHYFKA